MCVYMCVCACVCVCVYMSGWTCTLSLTFFALPFPQPQHQQTKIKLAVVASPVQLDPPTEVGDPYVFGTNSVGQLGRGSECDHRRKPTPLGGSLEGQKVESVWCCFICRPFPPSHRALDLLLLLLLWLLSCNPGLLVSSSIPALLCCLLLLLAPGP